MQDLLQQEPEKDIPETGVFGSLSGSPSWAAFQKPAMDSGRIIGESVNGHPGGEPRLVPKELEERERLSRHGCRQVDFSPVLGLEGQERGDQGLGEGGQVEERILEDGQTLGIQDGKSQMSTGETLSRTRQNAPGESGSLRRAQPRENLLQTRPGRFQARSA
jgi:hypothetical protein